MFADVGPGAEQAALLGAPESRPDRAPRFEAGRPQEPHRLHHDRAAGGVVRGAGAGRFGVEMAADHHDLVREVAAGQIGDHVVVERIVVAEDVADLDLHLDRRSGGQQPHHPVVVLGRDHDAGHRHGFVQRQRTVARDVDDPLVHRADVGGTDLDEDGNALLLQQRLDVVARQLGCGLVL